MLRTPAAVLPSQVVTFIGSPADERRLHDIPNAEYRASGW
jgi:hypothetical protein